MYAIVDIETTGANTSRNRVIEIAIVTTDGNSVLSQYSTLIDPGIPIPAMITGLTGITNDDVEGAPSFSDVCEEIMEELNGKVFVAHNVGFDYGFLRSEFEREGIDFQPRKLCTVRLARKIIPGYRSYSLGSICTQVGINITDRHRAMGDAFATALLFNKLFQIDKDQIDKSLKRNSREALLPPNLKKETFLNLPERPGVYYFHNQKGKVIYVGKADNLKKRVTGHFNSGSESRIKQDLFANIFDVSYELCGNELVSLLYEVAEIKRLWPEFNRESKRPANSYGVYIYEDSYGFKQLSIGKLVPAMKPAMTFRSFVEGRTLLTKLAIENDLCLKRCGIQKSACHHCSGGCIWVDRVSEYNQKLEMALSDNTSKGNFIIKGKGRTNDEFSLVMVEKGMFLGFGFISNDISVTGPEEVKDYITRYNDNPESRKILNFWLKKEKPHNINYY